MGPRASEELLRMFPRPKYEEFFQEADTNNDGYLSYDDVQKMCKKYSYKGPEHQLVRCFTQANTAGDGKLSYEEYMNAMGYEVEQSMLTSPSGRGISVSLLRQIFTLFDKDGNGEIDKTELEEVFRELGRHISTENVQRMMDMADQDGTGTLDYSEFIDILLKEGIAYT